MNKPLLEEFNFVEPKLAEAPNPQAIAEAVELLSKNSQRGY